MKWLKEILCGAALIAAMVAWPALAQDVHTDYDHNANFAQLHTFCWGRVHTADPLMQQRLQDAISRNLTAKGWQPASGSACDVSVSAIGYVHDRTEYNTFYGGFGPGWGWRGRWGWGGWGGGPGWTTVDEIPVGTLVIDLYNAHSKAILFRGTAKQDISNDADKNTGKLNKAVDRIFKDFPPRS